MNSLIDVEIFAAQAAQTKQPIPLFKQAIKQANTILADSFDAKVGGIKLVGLRSTFIDFILQQAWQFFLPNHDQATLVAVGGYGRAELHPFSDIDLLIIVKTADNDALNEQLSSLLTFLWDIGLEIGQSVRTLEECVEEAKKDITVITNLVEARYLTGQEALFNQMMILTDTDHIWPSDEFFAAKQQEQQRRHNRFDATAYNLEPNIKENQGGLRDIQTIVWITKRHFKTTHLSDLVQYNFLTQQEYEDLMQGQKFLWDIRYALHLVSKRREDRLVFDFQGTLANMFGYKERANNLGIETFMQGYYKTVRLLGQINERLLALFEEEILLKDKPAVVVNIDSYFQIKNGFIRTHHDQVFELYPLGLLEIFSHIQNNPESIKGIGAKTARLIQQNLFRINEEFRQNPLAQDLFMAMFRAPQGLTNVLRKMHRFGVLAAYLADFNNIVGRMQYDLFHVYTVDEHTLFVVRNLRRFMIEEFHDEFPLCSDTIKHLYKPELVYLAGLFHDIAKGRGGDHAELGANIARKFAETHRLSAEDKHLMGWLVDKHLIFSMTAQRQDISDPDVILEFARKIKTLKQLDYLYLLTVADMRATDPKKWNSWKNSLLKQLYHATKRTLIRGLQSPEEANALIENIQQQALQLIDTKQIEPHRIQQHWQQFSPEYFLQFPASSLAWHTQQVINLKEQQLPFIGLQLDNGENCTEIIVYSQDRPFLFGAITQVLDQLCLNIVNARITTDKQGRSIDSFQVLEPDGNRIHDEFRKQEIIARLHNMLQQTPSNKAFEIQPYRNRQHAHFDTPTQLDYCRDPSGQYTIMKLTTGDRPSLLALVGGIFKHCGIRLHQAKITTLGENAEDTFFITNHEGNPLNNTDTFQCIQRGIFEQLDGE